jgi:hypothetical protein
MTFQFASKEKVKDGEAQGAKGGLRKWVLASAVLISLDRLGVASHQEASCLVISCQPCIT